jgi:hypothetical protein
MKQLLKRLKFFKIFSNVSNDEAVSKYNDSCRKEELGILGLKKDGKSTNFEK